MQQPESTTPSAKQVMSTLHFFLILISATRPVITGSNKIKRLMSCHVSRRWASAISWFNLVESNLFQTDKTGRKESMERLQEMAWAGQGVLYVDTKHLTSNKMSGSSGAWELVFLCLYVCVHHRGNFGKWPPSGPEQVWDFESRGVCVLVGGGGVRATSVALHYISPICFVKQHR